MFELLGTVFKIKNKIFVDLLKAWLGIVSMKNY